MQPAAQRFFPTPLSHLRAASMTWEWPWFHNYMLFAKPHTHTSRVKVTQYKVYWINTKIIHSISSHRNTTLTDMQLWVCSIYNTHEKMCSQPFSVFHFSSPPSGRGLGWVFIATSRKPLTTEIQQMSKKFPQTRVNAVATPRETSGSKSKWSVPQISLALLYIYSIINSGLACFFCGVLLSWQSRAQKRSTTSQFLFLNVFKLGYTFFLWQVSVFVNIFV